MSFAEHSISVQVNWRLENNYRVHSNNLLLLLLGWGDYYVGMETTLTAPRYVRDMKEGLFEELLQEDGNFRLS